MSEDQKFNNPFKNPKFQHKEPVKQKGNPVQKGDPHLVDALEDEIEDIDDLERKECVKEPDKCSICDLKKEVDALKAAIDESREKLIRAHAEMENLRARSERKIQEAHRFALEKFVHELLPIMDNLERAIENTTSNETIASLIQGVDLTQKLFLKVLAQFGVKQLDPVGEPFNHAYHEAISVQENPEVESNTILMVLQKGYVLNDRLVRPARVVVSK